MNFAIEKKTMERMITFLGNYDTVLIRGSWSWVGWSVAVGQEILSSRPSYAPASKQIIGK